MEDLFLTAALTAMRVSSHKGEPEVCVSNFTFQASQIKSVVDIKTTLPTSHVYI